MKAVILAAGQGTRLRPLTDDKPKPLVELCGISLLERIVDTLQSADIEDILVVTGYEAETIEALGYDTVRNERYDETEMVYSLMCAEEWFEDDEDLVISYGDIVYDESIVKALSASEAALSVVVDLEWRELWDERFEDPLADAETLRLEDENIVEIGTDPDGFDEIEGQYIGLVKVGAGHVNRFSAAYKELIAAENAKNTGIHMTPFIQHLVEEGWDVQAVSIHGNWLEVDSVDDLQTYEAIAEDGNPIAWR